MDFLVKVCTQLSHFDSKAQTNVNALLSFSFYFHWLSSLFLYCFSRDSVIWPTALVYTACPFLSYVVCISTSQYARTKICWRFQQDCRENDERRAMIKEEKNAETLTNITCRERISLGDSERALKTRGSDWQKGGVGKKNGEALFERGSGKGERCGITKKKECARGYRNWILIIQTVLSARKKHKFR